MGDSQVMTYTDSHSRLYIFTRLTMMWLVKKNTRINYYYYYYYNSGVTEFKIRWPKDTRLSMTSWEKTVRLAGKMGHFHFVVFTVISSKRNSFNKFMN